MKQIALFLLAVILLCGCSPSEGNADIAATTLPIYDFTSFLCQNTPLTVTRLVTEEVSCLHDYTLNVRQVKSAEAADLIVISGAGLEDFMDDILTDKTCVDASNGIALLCPDEDDHHEHGHDHGHDTHNHDSDPHVWLSPVHAKTMADNICLGLQEKYPQYRDIFAQNLTTLHQNLDALQSYGKEQLSSLSCRELITFHDGFAYFAEAFDLTILEAVEEESGREASAKELIHMIEEVQHHKLPSIFTEVSGSVSAASIIARETGCNVYALDMAMTGSGYFEAMYHNINTVKEALQ